MIPQTTTTVVAHLHGRTNYTLHYRNLFFLLSLKATLKNVEYVVIVKQVHTILSFNHSAWTQPYSLGNNDLRTNDKHDVARLSKLHE